MGQDTALLAVISKLDSDIDTQRGRIGLMQRWLDDHSARLDDLAARIDASLARLDAIIAGSPVRR
jgi:flagellin-like hook-associated protein FlgL